MTRVKRGTIANKRRKNVLQHVKGFLWGRKSKFRSAKQALLKAWTYAFRDRRTKKREKRRLWQTQISAACKPYGISYSQFIHQLKINKIDLNRKVLAEMANNNQDIFEGIIKKVRPQ